MKYPGKELEIFDKAKIFQKYIYLITKKYFKNNILEVGAGIGSFTRSYLNNFSNIHLSELDQTNHSILKKKFFNKKNIKIDDKTINEVNSNFNTIIYLNVLEHIKEDEKEIELALSKLNPGGCLIILVPAHQNLFGKFDEAVGHYRRYDISFFKSKNYENIKIKKLIHLDMVGYFLYFFNKMFFNEEIYPSKIKIFLWDKIFTPITIFIDFLTGYKFGKNILCIYQKDG
tara:strand:- start:6051 stop:6737 length:687 start_codon:yes stop_codon:yes gene_type:complete